MRILILLILFPVILSAQNVVIYSGSVDKYFGAMSANNINMSLTTSYKAIPMTIAENNNTTYTDSSFTIDATGYYTIQFNAAISCTDRNIVYEGALFENDIENSHHIEFRQDNGTGSQASNIRSVGWSSACHYMTAGTVIKAKLKVQTGSAAITLYSCHFSFNKNI